ncbi:MAG: hypothetical protein C7B44_11710 [Sulfobacillus thermosulfidooxidans]|nr:MAG: hypothetical protein C7B44_11710 [Sulfobacillus thermosulfidooxidans]
MGEGRKAMGIALAIMLIVVFASFHLYRRTRPSKVMPVFPLPALPKHTPRVSFLVPAWNDGPHIVDFVAHYKQLTYPDKELILCVGGNDRSEAMARSLADPDIHVITQHAGEGKQVALRHSYSLSSGDIIYLTDIDCRLQDDTVNNLLGTMLNNGYQAVTGASKPLKEQELEPFVQIQWAIDQYLAPHLTSSTSGLLGRNAAVMRHALNAVNAFNEDVAAGTDYFLAKKLLAHGFRIYYVPGYPVATEYPDSIPVYIHKQARWIRNVFVLGRKFHNHSEVFSALKTLLLPVVTAALLLTSIILASAHSPIFWPIATTALLSVLHPYLNRRWYLKQAGLKISGPSPWLHWYADMRAAMRATWQILRNKVVW